MSDEFAKQYLAKHPEIEKDKKLQTKAYGAHLVAISDGVNDYAVYEKQLDETLGFQAEPKQRTVKLEPEMREAAKFSGVSDLEYAYGVEELNRRKASGYYDVKG